MWDEAHAEHPGAVDIPGLGGAAFVTEAPGANDLFAVKGQVGLHVYVFGRDPVEQLTAIAKAAPARL